MLIRTCNQNARSLGCCFDEIYNKAISGLELSDSELWRWEKRKDELKVGMDSPDVVEMSGMIRGFEPSFPAGFPGDLKEKLMVNWYNCRNVQERYEFMRGFLANFSQATLPDGRPRWTSDWRELATAVMGALHSEGTEFKDNQMIEAFLRNLL